MHMYDVVICGNGVLGMATARAIAMQDPLLRVAVVGPATRPGAASPAAGAMLGSFGEVTGPLLRTPSGRARFATGRRAAELWTSWLEGINADLDRDSQLDADLGTFLIRNSKSGTIEDENYVAIKQAVAEAGEPCEDIDANEVPGLNPVEDCRPSEALFLPREGSIDANRLMTTLARLIEQSRRQTMVDGTVAELDIRDGRLAGVRLADDTVITSPQVVLAMGVGTQAVLDRIPELAARIPRMFAGVGTSLLLEVKRATFPHVVRTPNRSFACGLHAVPRGGHLYCGATNNLSIEPRLATSPGQMTFLLDCVLDQLDQGLFTASLVRWSAGNRPVTVDTCPLIGPTSVDGLWLLTGTYRDGLFLSPLLSQHLARRLCGKPGLIGDEFLPERKPISVYTQEEARADAVRHFLAMSSEHGMRLPRTGWHLMLPRFYQQMVDQVYDSLADQEFVLPPEFVGIAGVGKPSYFLDYFAQVRKAWS